MLVSFDPPKDYKTLVLWTRTHHVMRPIDWTQKAGLSKKTSDELLSKVSCWFALSKQRELSFSSQTSLSTCVSQGCGLPISHMSSTSSSHVLWGRNPRRFSVVPGSSLEEAKARAARGPEGEGGLRRSRLKASGGDRNSSNVGSL